MGDLSEPTPLISVEVDVVDEERSGTEGAGGDCGHVGGEGTVGGTVTSPEAIRELAELKVNLDLMVLQSNEWEGKTGVAVEPELERHVKDLARHGKGVAGAGSGLGDLSKARGVTDHVGITKLMTGGLGELVPDVEPVTVMFIDPLQVILQFSILKVWTVS